jgi:iron complex outermembrane recepter protein
MFKRTQISTCALLALGGALMVPAAPAFAQDTQRIEVTGSRIKRAEAEGALPVTVITRADLEASGQTTIAEVIRSMSVMTSGNFRPQSGSSAQAFSEANLRGLGSRRTLVLVDGRRIAKSPIVGDAVDMNSIPMAAVERIEVLTDGASAVYGSDAIGGVINVILRKDFEGVALSYGETQPDVKGGDRTEASAIMGLTGDKGRVILGASKTSRDIIFVRDYPWGAARGASTYANNYFRAPGFGSGGSFIAAVPGANACNGTGFYVTNRCRYDFNLVAADEAAISTNSFFARGEVTIAKDWTAFMTSSVNKVGSFGRYAPVPGDVQIDPGSPAHPWTAGSPAASLQSSVGATETIFLAHRFAAGGNRDTSTNTNLYDFTLGVNGKLLGVDVEAGVRRSNSTYTEVGRGFVIETLARQAIFEGRYNIFAPFSATEAALQSFTATVGRDAKFASSDYWANATFDLFKLDGGSSRLFVNAEYRKEVYADIYDSLSEAGIVLGSSGNSAAGSRKVGSLSTELVMPITKELEATIAGRYEKYSDYGNDFSPKLSLRFQPMKTLTLRAAAGKGFSAPTLPQLTAKPAFSADDAIDLRHCLADGGFTPAECADDRPPFQVNGLVISNPALTSEKSTQFSLGAVWDITPQLSIKADYWNTKIDGVISVITAQDIINRDNGDDPRPIPAGLSIRRDPVTGSIQQIVRGSTNEGLLKKSGIDLDLQFGSYNAGDFGKLKHGLTWSRVLKDTLDGENTNGIFESPKDRASLSTKWSLGSFEATWNVNMVGKHGDDNVGFVKAYITHDIQGKYNLPIKGAAVTIGAINAGGKLPELVTDGAKPFSYNLYDAYGAQYYVRAEMKF